MFKVRKNDGTVVDFDRSKITQGITKAGGSEQEAEAAADEIEKWLPGVVNEGIVNSLQIRAKVLELLKQTNATVAMDFEMFQKPVKPVEA